MKIFKWISVLVLLTISLAACAPSAAGPSDASTTQTPAIDLPASAEPGSSAPVPATSGPKGGAEPQAALVARQSLAQQLGVSPEEIQIIKAEKTDWPDSCLGIQVQGMVCAQVIVPGYLVVFEHAGKQYVFRTDETGGDVRLAVAPEPQVGEVAINWQGQDGACETILIGSQGVAFGPCGGTLMQGKLVSQQRANDLAYFTNTYASFAADTPAGKVNFTGKGSQTASEAEQRMIAEWSRLVYTEASGGGSGASYGLAIGWHREGGIAGFCDDLEVYVYGFGSASSCKGGQANQLGQGYLNADELSQLYSWVDSLKSFEVNQKDPATADAMSIRMVFQGMGSKEPTDADKTAILNFASQLYTELAQAGPASTPTENPQQALTEYFNALSEGRYADAANFYGGSYEVLAQNNPSIALEDQPGLFEAGCKVNGFQCLKIKNVVKEEQVSPEQYKYTVEFSNPDGSLFTRGPCCGANATDSPPESQFEFTVLKSGGQFLVQELPVYVP